MSDIKTIPCLPCTSLEVVFDFYQILGFEITYRQTSPSEYGILRRDGYELHFYGLKALKPDECYSVCIVVVPEVENLHRDFAEALRASLGRFPVAGFPRLTRMKAGQGRFTLVDPCGNSVIYVKPAPLENDRPREKLTGLAKAQEAARRLRDERGDDIKAAKTLDAALGRSGEAPPVERARALAARIELAVALNDPVTAKALRLQLASIELSDAEREAHRDELEAAERLEKLL